MIDMAMSLLSAYLEFLSAVAWPVTTLLIVFLLLPEIRNAVRTISNSRKGKASGPGFSIEWETLASNAEAQIRQVIIPPSPALEALKSELPDAGIALESNSDQIRASYRLVREALDRAAATHLAGEWGSRPNESIVLALANADAVESQLVTGVRALDNLFASFTALGSDPGSRNTESFKALARAILERVPV